ncbi:putative PRP38 family domain-containing protein [Balamuthia mandrillaris]
MRFDDEQEKDLKRYLINSLEPICAADPSVLSNYIIALLKRDKPKDELLRLCQEELMDFLGGETHGFVNALFDTLNRRSSFASSKKKNDEDGYEDDSQQLDSRKRDRYEDQTDASSYDSLDQNKRGRREHEVEEGEAEGGDQYRSSSRDHYRSSSREREDSGERSSSRHRDVLDANNGGVLRNPRRGSSRSDREDRSRDRDRERDRERERGDRDRSRDRSHREDRGRDRERSRRRICRDYEKGYCLRGALCPYEHQPSGKAEGPVVMDEQELYRQHQHPQLMGDTGSLEEQSYNPDEPFLVSQGVVGAGGVWHQPQGVPPQQMPFPPVGGMNSGGMVPSLVPPAMMGGGGLGLPLPPPHHHGGGGFSPQDGGVGGYHHNNRGGRGGYHRRGGGGGREWRDHSSERTTDAITLTDSGSASSRDKDSTYGGGRGARGRGRGGRGGRGGLGRFGGEDQGREGGGDRDGHAEGRKRWHQDSAYQQQQGGSDQGGGPPFKRQRQQQVGYQPRAQRNNIATDTITVTRIPAESNNIETLNSHFKKFGTIVNIQIEPHENKAHVQFTSHAEALKAFRSPEPVLSNRFIGVYLRKEDSGDASSAASTSFSKRAPSPPVHIPTTLEKAATLTPALSKAAAPTASTSTSSTSAASPGPTAASLELGKKLQEQKLELRKKQLEKQQQLLQKLEAMKGIKSKEKEELMSQLTLLTKQINESIAKDKQSLSKVPKVKPEVAVVASAPSIGTTPKKMDRTLLMKEQLDRELESITQLQLKKSQQDSSSSDTVATKARVEELKRLIAEKEKALQQAQESKEGEGKGAGEKAKEGEENTEQPGEKDTSTNQHKEQREEEEEEEANNEGEENNRPLSRLDMLKSKLSSLQQEATTLGIDAPLTPVPYSRSTRGGAAAGRGAAFIRGGRARGTIRGTRGAASWRGGRGRGRGGGPSAFKLDNRTTVIRVQNLPEELRSEELLRAHFQSFGSILSVVYQEDGSALVQFDTRRMAEMAFQHGQTYNNQTMNFGWFDKMAEARAAAQPGASVSSESSSATGAAEQQQEEGSRGDVVEEYAYDEEDYSATFEDEVNEEEEEDQERSWKR